MKFNITTMKNLFFLIALCCVHQCYGQLTVNIILPPSGMMEKQQLWNIFATNTETSPLSVQAQITFSELETGQPVFTASSSFTVGTGTRQLSATSIDPVQYNILNPDYRIDPGPTGLLPIGSFSVCYDFLVTKYNKVVRECQQITVPPLGPLLLNQPSDQAELSELHPMFNWLPPSPVNSLANLRYELRLTEILPGQSAADAIHDNIPVATIRNLATNNFQYSQGLPALSPNTHYAWQVIAFNNLTETGKSETWSFHTKQDAAIVALSRQEPAYIKLEKEGMQNGYAVFWGNLRFDYLNETSDSVWHILVEDLSTSKHTSFALSFDTLKLKRGPNLLHYNATEDSRFINKHLYLLKVPNSRNEIWQIRFEYRKPD